MLFAEHALEFGLVDIFYKCSQVFGHFTLGFTVIFFDRHLEQQLGFFQLTPALLPAGDDILELAKLLLDLLRLISVGPEIGRQGLTLQPLHFFFLGG
jgi:hypothetical protein